MRPIQETKVRSLITHHHPGELQCWWLFLECVDVREFVNLNAETTLTIYRCKKSTEPGFP